MKIGIDFDGVIVKEPSDGRTDVIDRYMLLHGYNIVDPGTKKWVTRYGIDMETLQRLHPAFINAIAQHEVNRFKGEGIDSLQLIQGAKEGIDALRGMGHGAHLITARGTVKGSINLGMVKQFIEITKNFLDEHNIEFDGYEFGHDDKLPICQSLGIQLMIDDKLRHMERLSMAGIKTFQFIDPDHQWQQPAKHIKATTLVHSWDEIVDRVSQMS